MLRKCHQPHSNFHVNRRQPKIAISRRRRTRANQTPTRSRHSTRTKVPGKAKLVLQEPGLRLEPVRGKVKTRSGTHPSSIARVRAPGKAKEKGPERAKLKTGLPEPEWKERETNLET